MIVLDTTILVYAVGADHRLAEPCRRLMETIETRRVEATTAVEVIQEFAHVYARRRERRDASRLARSYADLLAPLLVFDRDDLERGLGLFERHAPLGAFDALLAAAALGRESDALVSTDAAFRGVPRLKLIEPLTPEFEALVAG